MKQQKDYGWVLFHEENNGFKKVAHKTYCAVTHVPFIPVFHTRKDALAFRDQRLKMTRIFVRKFRFTSETP